MNVDGCGRGSHISHEVNCNMGKYIELMWTQKTLAGTTGAEEEKSLSEETQAGMAKKKECEL